MPNIDLMTEGLRGKEADAPAPDTITTPQTITPTTPGARTQGETLLHSLEALKSHSRPTSPKPITPRPQTSAPVYLTAKNSRGNRSLRRQVLTNGKLELPPSSCHRQVSNLASSRRSANNGMKGLISSRSVLGRTSNLQPLNNPIQVQSLYPSCPSVPPIPHNGANHSIVPPFGDASTDSRTSELIATPKPYACQIQGCSKRYTDPSSLRKHIKSHSVKEQQARKK
ncbi:hypothetical protein DNTS_004030, partial [Danionella cerebrum]